MFKDTDRDKEILASKLQNHKKRQRTMGTTRNNRQETRANGKPGQ